MVVGAGWVVFVASRAYQLTYVTATGRHPALSVTVNLFKWLPSVLAGVPKGAGVFLADAVIILAMSGPGSLIRRYALRARVAGRMEGLVFDVALGLTAYVPLVLIVGTYVGLARWTMSVLTALYLSPAMRALRPAARWMTANKHLRAVLWQRAAQIKPLTVVLCIGLAITLYYLLLGSLGPVIDWDAQAYHLAAPKHYVEAGHFYNIIAATHDPYLDLNPYQEIIYTPFFSMLGLHAAKLVGWFEAALTCLALVAFTRRFYRSVNLGLMAAIAYLSVPLVFWDATSGYNDIALGTFGFLSFYAIWVWLQSPGAWGWAAMSSICAAFALGVKEFGLITLGLVVATMIIRSVWDVTRSNLPVRSAVWSTGGAIGAAALTCGAWWARAAATTGDFLFPAASGIFRNPYWDPHQNALLIADHIITHNGLFSLVTGLPQNLWLHAVKPIGAFTGTNEIVGPLFVIAVPLCGLLLVLTARRPSALVMYGTAFSLAWTCGWWLADAISSRYLIGVAPVACLMIFVIGRDAVRQPRLGSMPNRALALLVAAAAVSGAQVFGGFLKSGGTGRAVGVVAFQPDYLYGTATDYSVAGRWFPVIQYVNRHFPSARTKVYDDAGQVQGYLFLNAEIFNGVQGGSPPDMGQWTLWSTDAYAKMRANHIDLLMAPLASREALARAPLARHLTRLYTADGVDLYAVGAAARKLGEGPLAQAGRALGSTTGDVGGQG
jgi:hypothetical protein